MAEITIKNASGKEAGSLDISDAVFGIEPNLGCVRAAFDGFRANQRAGTHSTKTRSTVHGGGKKPWKQKGTGRARQGTIRAVQWRGGAVAFGPHPRDYGYRVNRKVRKKAIQSVLSSLHQSNNIFAVDDFGLSAPKTKDLVQALQTLGISGSALIITESLDKNVALSARNLPKVRCVTTDNLNIYDLLVHDNVVATSGALTRIGEVYS